MTLLEVDGDERMNRPLNPAGPFEPTPDISLEFRSSLIDELGGAPERWSTVANTLPPAALDVKYRNWTVRQIIHHVADSHVNEQLPSQSRTTCGW